MPNSLSRTDREIEAIYNRHINAIYRLCFTYMKNAADTEDAVQDAFIKMMTHKGIFENQNHERAWLIVAAANVCKDKLKHRSRKHADIADYEYLAASGGFEPDETICEVIKLPEKYKCVIFMYYYEGYNSREIASALRKPPSTVRNLLHEARELLRTQINCGKIGVDFDAE